MQSGRTIARVGRRPAEQGRHLARQTRRRVGEPSSHGWLRPHRDDSDAEPLFPGLHWMTAVLFAAAGTEAALRLRRGQNGGGAPDLLRMSPVVAAPLAGLVHAVRARNGAPLVRLTTQVLDGLAAGIAVAGLAAAAYHAVDAGGMGPGRRTARRLAAALVPLTFGATACLGLLLEREEESERYERRRLQRRASVVERLVPRRHSRLDRIVVHV